MHPLVFAHRVQQSSGEATCTAESKIPLVKVTPCIFELCTVPLRHDISGEGSGVGAGAGVGGDGVGGTPAHVIVPVFLLLSHSTVVALSLLFPPKRRLHTFGDTSTAGEAM
jgi:hypothetical protein